MVYVIVVVAWFLVGAAVGVLDARRGHWRKSWVVSAILGPFAIGLALGRRHVTPPSPTVLTTGEPRRGPVDLLLGFDGSPSSMNAAALAVGLFGPRVRRVTLATVLDVDTATQHADSPFQAEPWPEELAARHDLDAAVSSLGVDFGIKAGSVILAGVPGEALERYAADEGYELLVIGSRGKGLSKLMLGSCASRLAGKTKVPVMIIPAGPTTQLPSAVTPSKSSAM